MTSSKLKVFYYLGFSIVFFALMIIIFRFFYYHKVNNLNFENSLTGAEKTELRQIMNPVIKSGYYNFDLENLIEKISGLPWVAKAQISKVGSFSVNTTIEKDIALFLFNDKQYINQYLKISELKKNPTIDTSQIKSHIYAKTKQIKDLISAYNQLIRKFNQTKAILNLEITALKMNSIEQIRIGLLIEMNQIKEKLELNFGNQKLNQRMNSLVNHLSKIITEAHKLRKRRGSKKSTILVDLRFPKGFSLKVL